MPANIKVQAMKCGKANVFLTDGWNLCGIQLSPAEALVIGERLIAIGNKSAMAGEKIFIQQGDTM